MTIPAQAYKRPAAYERYAIDFDKAYYGRIIDQIRAHQTPSTPRRLLDVGCFDGSLARVFEKEWEVYGLEGDETACQKAQAAGVRATCHDLEKKFPYENGMFDAVIAAEIIEHVYDTDFFLREIQRVLKPGGVLVMSIPNIACLSNRLKMLFGGYPRYAEYRAGGAGHIRVYTAKTIYNQLRENGFGILKYAGCNLPLPMHQPWVPRWLKRLAIRGGDYFPSIAGQVVLTARNLPL